MHVIVSLSANLKINDWLSLQARGNVDYINDKVRQQFYASTAPALAGANGRYIEMDYQETQYYGDAILMMKKQWDAFSLNAALGASINDKTVNSTRYDLNSFAEICQCVQSGQYHHEWFRWAGPED